MNIIDKIKWRIDFLQEKSKGNNIKVIIYNLLPARSQLAEKIIFNELKKYPELIKIEKLGKDDLLLDIGTMKLVYPKKLRISSVVGVYLDLIYPYVKKYQNKKISLLEFFPEHEGPYETKGFELQKGNWVIDAGAYIGIFSIFASKKVGEAGKIFAFEPILEARELLKRNIDLNGIKNIEIVPFALGEKKGEIIFSTPSRTLGVSSGFFDNEGTTETVKQISLDEFVEENKIPRIDFIKSDIEGMERNFLAGAAATIKKFKPKLAICIYHRPDDPEVLEKMIREFSPDYKIIKGEKKIFASNK